MKVLVFGGTGCTGSAAAWDLARYGGVDLVGITGRSSDALEKAMAWINSEKVGRGQTITCGPELIWRTGYLP